MEMLSHEKLDVYQCAIQFLTIVTEIPHKMPRGYGYISDQLHRASLSISYNIKYAEAKMLLVRIAQMLSKLAPK